MTQLERALQLARQDVTQPTFEFARDYLSVHQVPLDASGMFAVSHVDETAVPGGYVVYFPLAGEPYHYVVVVIPDDSGELHVNWAYIQPAVRVYLHIYSLDVAPDVITSRVGLSPTRAGVRGEPRPIRPNRVHFWQFEPEMGVPGDVEENLARLLNLIEPVAARLASLRPSCSLDIRVVYEGWSGNSQFGGMHIDAEAIRRIASLGAGVDIDIYASGKRLPDNHDLDDEGT